LGDGYNGRVGELVGIDRGFGRAGIVEGFWMEVV